MSGRATLFIKGISIWPGSYEENGPQTDTLLMFTNDFLYEQSKTKSLAAI